MTHPTDPAITDRRKNMKRLGIIGGMGPEATVEFMMRLLRATYAEDDQDHIPVIADNNSQVPSRITWLLENKGADPVPEILRTTRRLCEAGADFLVMPCNTTHAFAPQIVETATVPFLHAIEIAALCSHENRGTACGGPWLARDGADRDL